MSDTLRTEFISKAGPPCAACPWRTANQGKRNGVGWYSKKNLTRLWAGMRRGERMTCHPTDPDNPANPVNGACAKPGGVTEECRGAMVLVQRELERFQTIAKEDEGDTAGALRRYKAENPRGLTRDGLFAHLSSMAFAFPGEIKPAAVNLNETSVSLEGLVPWEPR